MTVFSDTPEDRPDSWAVAEMRHECPACHMPVHPSVTHFYDGRYACLPDGGEARRRFILGLLSAER